MFKIRPFDDLIIMPYYPVRPGVENPVQRKVKNFEAFVCHLKFFWIKLKCFRLFSQR